MNNQRRNAIREVMRSLETSTEKIERIRKDYRGSMKKLEGNPDNDPQIKNMEQQINKLDDIAFDMEDMRLALEDVINGQ